MCPSEADMRLGVSMGPPRSGKVWGALQTRLPAASQKLHASPLISDNPGYQVPQPNPDPQEPEYFLQLRSL